MKRMLCLLLVMVLMLSMCVQAFADDDILYCRMCGKRIPTDSKVCPHCGEKVVHVEDDEKAEEKNTKPGAEEMPKIAETPAAPAAAPSAPTETSSAPTAAPSTLTAAPSAPTAAPSAPTAAQSAAASPATATAPVPGPFHTTIGANNTLLGHVYVTKSPTSESVPYGGSCMFIAHAANATSVTWYIANSDASLITTVAEAPNRVSGLSVSGANSDTLVLYGIPSYMNGCQVQACFNGEGGPVYSDIARIWTYQPAPQPSNNGWSFWDWFNYCYWDDPEIPWWYWEDFRPARPAAAPRGFHPEIDAEKTEVKHIGHYNPLDPSNSWWDPRSNVVPNSSKSDFELNTDDGSNTTGDSTAGGNSSGAASAAPSNFSPGNKVGSKTP